MNSQGSKSKDNHYDTVLILKNILSVLLIFFGICDISYFSEISPQLIAMDCRSSVSWGINVGIVNIIIAFAIFMPISVDPYECPISMLYTLQILLVILFELLISIITPFIFQMCDDSCYVFMEKNIPWSFVVNHPSVRCIIIGLIIGILITIGAFISIITEDYLDEDGTKDDVMSSSGISDKQKKHKFWNKIFSKNTNKKT